MADTVLDAINRIKTNIANGYTAISNKGGSIPTASSRTSANLPTYISRIPTTGPRDIVTVQPNKSTFGTVSQSGSGEYPHGTEVSVTATANSKYHPFLWWLENGEQVSTDNPYKFTAGE